MELILSCLNKQTKLVLTVTTTVIQILEEVEKGIKEALAATEATGVEEIAQIILPLPNHCLKENYEMGAYISSLSLKGCIKPQNSKKSMRFCSSYEQIRVTNILTI